MVDRHKALSADDRPHIPKTGINLKIVVQNRKYNPQKQKQRLNIES